MNSPLIQHNAELHEIIRDFNVWELSCEMGCFPEDLGKRAGKEIETWMGYMEVKRARDDYRIAQIVASLLGA